MYVRTYVCLHHIRTNGCIYECACMRGGCVRVCAELYPSLPKDSEEMQLYICSGIPETVNHQPTGTAGLLTLTRHTRELCYNGTPTQDNMEQNANHMPSDYRHPQ